MWSKYAGMDQHHEVWILTNDKDEVLARIEGFGMGSLYPWVMDDDDVDSLRRLGPTDAKLEDVKKRCEEILVGAKKFPSKGTATTDRADPFRGF